jgi:hypothetical protein
MLNCTPNTATADLEFGINQTVDRRSPAIVLIINAVNYCVTCETLLPPLLHHYQGLMLHGASTTSMASNYIVFARVPHICSLGILIVLAARCVKPS